MEINSLLPQNENGPSVSVIITTYNRWEALSETLDALARQTVPPDDYEILVVDNGCSDGTSAFLASCKLPCHLKTYREPENVGIAAARNIAIANACGKNLILVSDDLIVPENFIATHLETLERFPGYWVVGGFQQLDSLTETPFGRYLDQLESSFEEARKSRQLAPDVWEMNCPTARNLSLPRADLMRIGLFDEQFRNSCEDQDLAHRAQEVGIRFLYNAAITCLHNDQAGELKRYCRAQERGAHDTVFFCAKYSLIHGDAAIARLNGYVSFRDGPGIIIKKLVKSAFATRPLLSLIEKTVPLVERMLIPDVVLWTLYRFLIGLYIFRGWREGLYTLRHRKSLRGAYSIGCQSNV